MTVSAFLSPSLPLVSLEPTLVGFGEPGLTPLRLAGRRFRVCDDCSPGFWCACGPDYAGYPKARGLSAGQVGEFNSVSLTATGDWETVLRFPGGIFMGDVELFRLLPLVKILPEDDFGVSGFGRNV